MFKTTPFYLKTAFLLNYAKQKTPRIRRGFLKQISKTVATAKCCG
jgi:hypothetical protein